MEFGEKFFQRMVEGMRDGVYFVDSSLKIVFWNKGAEKITGFMRDEVLGRSCAHDILVHMDDYGCKVCGGDCPLARTLEDGKGRIDRLFLHNKEGHRIPVEVTVSPVRVDGDGIVGAVEVFRPISEKEYSEEFVESLKKAALTDTLTSLPNRRFLEMKISSNLVECQRYEVPFGLLFADIDDFKGINDRHGHEIGDRVLKMVSNTLMSNIRGSDVAGRWGGEELVVILHHLEEERLLPIAEKLRRLVERSFFMLGNEKIRCTITIGATMGKAGDDLDEVVKRADRLMYQGKKSKNCVVPG